ncbi:MAG: hypothetical protein ACR2QT_05705 [Woeseiaceae bacterium]
MAATQAEVQQSPDSIVLEMSQVMETCAASGEWERVEEIAETLRGAIMQVPERRRRDALLAVQRSIEQVHTLAQGARNEVGDQLSVLRRGQDARKAYEFTD